MMKSKVTGVLLSVLLLLFFTAQAALARAHRITITDLGTLGGFVSKAVAVNSLGEAAGESTTSSGKTHPFLWRNGMMIDLGTLGGDYGKGVGLNGNSQVIGESSTAAGAVHAFIWQNSLMTDLGSLNGRNGTSTAHAINNSGQVVGESATPSGATHAFLWQKGTMIDLGTLGGRDSRAFDINEKGQVTGESTTARGDLHAFFWWQGKMTDLGVPSGGDIASSGIAINNLPQVLAASEALLDFTAGVWQGGRWTPIRYGKDVFPHAMNDLGQVVGEAFLGFISTHGFIWQNGAVKDLGALNGGAETSGFVTDPTAINNSGQVVGTSTTSTGGTHAFIWQAGSMVDLGSLGGDSFAYAISENGFIAGGSINPLGEMRATLWRFFF